ncbi:MAG: alpha/beta fold hydrolase [Actinomycetota bacterium]
MSGVQQLVLSRRNPLRATPGLSWGPIDLPERGTTWALDQAGPDPEAPTVVLLHGLAATGALNWDPVIGTLVERFRVIALDHRGHGRGIEPYETFTLEDCADDVAALLEVCGVRRAVLVGYSMGGAIAQLTAHRHPHRVAGLVLLATAARFQLPPGSEFVTRVLA